MDTTLPPASVALVSPWRGLRVWQRAALQRAERAGAIRIDALITADTAPNRARDGAVAVLSVLDVVARAGAIGSGARDRRLRKLCHPRRSWPDVHRLTLAEAAAIPGARWDLIVNLASDAATTRLAGAARIGVLEFRIGRSQDIDEVLEFSRLGRRIIPVSGVLVRGGDRRLVGQAVAGVRERTLIVSSLELLLARAATVLSRSIATAVRPEVRNQQETLPEYSPRSARPFRSRHASQLLTSALGDYARTAVERLRDGMPQWFLAYREWPDHFVANALTCSPTGLGVITPPAGRFYADPCVFTREGADHVFFEDFSYAAGKGAIAWMQHLGGGRFTEPVVVLEREYHLAYPFVFADGAEVYMIPESSQAGRVELYRAAAFPRSWERVAVLLRDINASDTTVLQAAGRWWMFTAVSEEGSSLCDELWLFYADSLMGPWRAHPANPVKSDVRSARPAGRLFRHGGRLIRPAQNCARLYGGSVVLCEVVELSTSHYRERVMTELHPGWIPGNRRFHTVSSSERLEMIDGSFHGGVRGGG